MRNFSQITPQWIKVTALWSLVAGLLASVTIPIRGEESAVATRIPARIAASSATDESVWTELPSVGKGSLVQIWITGKKTNAGGQCIVITHGMRGTLTGDSFHQLAAAIRRRFPQARVIRLDWSEKASAKFYGFLDPWQVARSIDAVGDQAALVLKKEGIDPARTTFRRNRTAFATH